MIKKKKRIGRLLKPKLLNDLRLNYRLSELI